MRESDLPGVKGRRADLDVLCPEELADVAEEPLQFRHEPGVRPMEMRLEPGVRGWVLASAMEHYLGFPPRPGLHRPLSSPERVVDRDTHDAGGNS